VALIVAPCFELLPPFPMFVAQVPPFLVLEFAVPTINIRL
jgi:hypothetical protein